jgi:hypothetical protein
VVRDAEGNVLNGFGHAMSFGVPTYASEGKEPKVIDTTIGPEITINFKNGIFSEGRNEQANPQEAIAEPEEATAPSDVPAEAQPQGYTDGRSNSPVVEQTKVTSNDAAVGASDCNGETLKSKAILDKCLKMNKGTNDYAQCLQDFIFQKQKAEQVCKAR